MAKTVTGDGPTESPREEALDPRVLLSRGRVLTTTLDLLTEAGLDELTIDEISRRSGVAKTTIYRHWPNRSCSLWMPARMTDGEETPPDTGSIKGDVRAILTTIAELLATCGGHQSCPPSSMPPNTILPLPTSTAASNAVTRRRCGRRWTGQPLGERSPQQLTGTPSPPL